MDITSTFGPYNVNKHYICIIYSNTWYCNAKLTTDFPTRFEHGISLANARMKSMLHETLPGNWNILTITATSTTMWTLRRRWKKNTTLFQQRWNVPSTFELLFDVINLSWLFYRFKIEPKKNEWLSMNSCKKKWLVNSNKGLFLLFFI